MKRVLLISINFLLLLSVHAQDSKFETTAFNPDVDSVAEKLVAMAMNHPSLRSSENFSSQFKYVYKMSKTAWLNNIVLQGNLNEYSIKDLTGSQTLPTNTLYPRYNVGVSIPLGIFINNPKQTKADYYKYKSTADLVEVERRNIREQVLTNYHNYLMDRQLLSLGQQLVHDWEIIYQANEDKFKKGEISLDVFYSSTRIYNDQLNRQVTLTGALRSDEAKLENLIGMNVNDALNMIKNRR